MECNLYIFCSIDEIESNNQIKLNFFLE
jgi:hypothetical protein